jgi:hypothetical protein
MIPTVVLPGVGNQHLIDAAAIHIDHLNPIATNDYMVGGGGDLLSAGASPGRRRW